jgi:SLA1 Homology Domain 1 (SHD1) protein
MSAVRRAALLLVVLAITNSASGREWTDASGQHSREGEFVSFRSGRIVVRVADGREVSTAWEQFSRADQAYVLELYHARIRTSAQPVSVAKGSVPARTAQYQPDGIPTSNPAQPPTGVAPAGTEPVANPEADAEADKESPADEYGGKLVYFTDCGKFHIILSKTEAGPIIGTAYHAMPYWWPPGGCCCCCCPCYGPWYLSFLRFSKNNHTYLEAREISGGSPTKYWRFYWVPRPWGYLIRYSTTGNDDKDFKFFGYACRRRPK